MLILGNYASHYKFKTISSIPARPLSQNKYGLGEID